MAPEQIRSVSGLHPSRFLIQSAVEQVRELGRVLEQGGGEVQNLSAEGGASRGEAGGLLLRWMNPQQTSHTLALFREPLNQLLPLLSPALLLAPIPHCAWMTSDELHNIPLRFKLP